MRPRFFAAMLMASLAMHVPRAALAGSAELRRFDIEAGTLDDALQAWARQSGEQILYEDNGTVRPVAAIHQRMAAADALRTILRGSGFVALEVGSGSWVLRSARIAVPPPPPVAKTPPVRQTLDMPSVNVLGSWLPDQMVRDTLPVAVIGRAEIDASGYASLSDLLAAQPGISAVGPVQFATADATSNVHAGAVSSVSISGFGSRGTLVLVDGRRMGGYGLGSADAGGVVDIDTIPLSVVDHIEIIRGGTSATYGADATAGVINIILKDDDDLRDISTQYGMSTRGDASTHRETISYGRRFGANAYGSVFIDHQRDDPLPGASRSWRTSYQRRGGLDDLRLPLGVSSDFPDMSNVIAQPGCAELMRQGDGLCALDQSRFESLRPAMERTTALARYRMELSPETALRFDLLHGVRTDALSSAPVVGFFRPDGPGDASARLYAFLPLGPLRSSTRQANTSASAEVEHVSGGWTWTSRYGFTRSDVSTVTRNAVDIAGLDTALKTGAFRFNDATLSPAVRDLISPALHVDGRSDEHDVMVETHGIVGHLPSGSIRVSAAAEWRRDRLESDPSAALTERQVALTSVFQARRLTQNIASLSGEANAPLTSTLDADLALRVDRPQGYGAGMSPRIAFRWQAFPRLAFRASLARGYRAPSLYERRQPPIVASSLQIAQSSAARCYFLFDLGADRCLLPVVSSEQRQLKPERSLGSTLGARYSDEGRWSVSLDRIQVQRSNEIAIIDPFTYPDLFPIATVVDAQGEPIGVNVRLGNLSRTTQIAWLAIGQYEWALGGGSRLVGRFSTQRIQHLWRRVAPGLPTVDTAGFDEPASTELFTLAWNTGRWQVATEIRHTGSRKSWDPGETCPDEKRAAGHCYSPPFFLPSVSVSYNVSRELSVRLSVRNVFDHQPKDFREADGGYRMGIDDAFGRYISIGATYRY